MTLLLRDDTCQAYIDYGRFIGDDPVGHCCINKASSEATIIVDGKFKYFRVCDHCKKLIEEEPERISFLL